MEFDNTYNGHVDWNFPSPSSTPTTASFNHNVFHTPKNASFPSHFQDVFTTPQMPTFSTPHQAEYASITPAQRPQSSSETLRSNYYANVQASGQAMGPPPAQFGYQGQMISPVPADGRRRAGRLSFDSSQMQTPPPTRGTHAKKAQAGQPIAFGTPSTIASRRFMTPQQAVQPGQSSTASFHTPMQVPHLQFSPQVYQFGNHGPATAPVLPQTQLLWEQSSPNMFASPNVLADPFAPSVSESMSWPVAPPLGNSAQTVTFDTPAMDSFPVQPPHPRPVPAAQTVPSSAPVQSHFNPDGVDPTLLYSSPIRPQLQQTGGASRGRSGGAQLGTKRSDESITGRSRADTVLSTDVPITSKGLRRSNTTGTVRPQSAHLTHGTDSLIRSNNLVPRTDSPLKRIGRPVLDPISETKKPRPRTSVILTVDENGRARTETKRLDESPTRSIRERYPVLFDSDSSDAESDVSGHTPSRCTSFSFTKGEERKHKAARLDPPIENLEGLSIPRSSSSASMKVAPSRAAIAAAAQLRRSGSLRRSTSNRNSQRRSANSLIDTCPMDGQDAHHGDDLARHALPDSFQTQDWGQGSTLDAHNRRWSMMSLEQQQQRPQSISPTHHYPPPPQASFTLSRPVRCTCGVANDNGQPLVQCRSCTQWSHAACIGVDPHTAAPPFTCFLCTKPSRTRRGP